MKCVTRFAAAGVLAVFVAAGTGCLALAAGAAVGAGTVAYVNGASTSVVKADPPAVIAATVKAFNDLSIYPVSKEVSKTSAEIDGKTADDTSVSVSVKQETDGVSKVWVRVGIFGDEALSNAIFAHIKKNL